MRTASLCSVCLLAAPLAAQDFLYYKFDGSSGVEVNCAEGPGAFPYDGVVESNLPTGAMTDGRFGGGLSGGDATQNLYARVRTGWYPSAQPLTGDLTLAFWLRQRTAPGSVNHLSGVSYPSGARVFTGGYAGAGLYYRAMTTGGGNGASPTDLILPGRYADVQGRAAAGWTHVAMVIDRAARTATWYHDGVVAYSRGNVGPAQIASPGEWMIGFQGTLNESNYDHDEFVLSNRAYSATEVGELLLGRDQREVPYTLGVTQCGAVTLGSYGGAPDVGNSQYGLELDVGGRQGVYVIVVGYRCDYLFGRVPLPLELSTFAPGCWLLTDIERLTFGRARGASTVQVPTPIPLNGLPGEVVVYAQGALFENGRNGSLHASNGLEVHVRF